MNKVENRCCKPIKFCTGWVALATGSNWLFRVNEMLGKVDSSQVFVRLFIFVKKQIMYFSMKS